MPRVILIFEIVGVVAKLQVARLRKSVVAGISRSVHPLQRLKCFYSRREASTFRDADGDARIYGLNFFRHALKRGRIHRSWAIIVRQ